MGKDELINELADRLRIVKLRCKRCELVANGESCADCNYDNKLIENGMFDGHVKPVDGCIECDHNG